MNTEMSIFPSRSTWISEVYCLIYMNSSQQIELS